jgi:ubiquinone/menaquinone biosynthesis C-methylase UbiE
MADDAGDTSAQGRGGSGAPQDVPNPTHAMWEELAKFHGTGDDAYYDLDKLRAGGSLMGDEELAALGVATDGRGLAGLTALHLQCHIGCDSISLARMGASVTAVDFSRSALDRLQQLATECGVDVTAVEADTTDLPHTLDGRFDLVYASIGVLCWIDDLDAWMRGATRALKPGGRLVVVDLHPVVTMVESLDPLVVNFPYVFDGPRTYDGTGSYANREADIAWSTTQYAHSIGEVVTTAARAGLACVLLEEHVSGSFNTGQIEGPEDDGRYRLRLGVGSDEDRAVLAEPMPVLFTFIAERRLNAD